MFKVAGVSTLNGVTKVRYANDLVTRFKMLNKGGHEDIKLYDLPQAMDKYEVTGWLLQHEQLMAVPHFAEAIKLAHEKYNPSTVKVTKPNMESLIARAEAVTAEQPEGWTTVNTGTEETAE
jgi:hypothetical protein